MNENSADPNLEEVEALWWREWFEADYSWEGLQRHDAPGFASLRDFWINTASPEAKLSDTHIHGELERMDGQKTYHVVHLPLYYEDGTPTRKVTNPDFIRMRIDDCIRIRLAKDAELRRLNQGHLTLWLTGGIYMHLDLGDTRTPRALDVHCRQSYFVGNAEFSLVQFGGFTDFQDCFFHGQVSFFRTNFEAFTFFNRSIWLDHVNFNCAVFESVAQFSNMESYDRFHLIETSFQGDVALSDSAFVGAASFELAKFAQYVTFESSSFDKMTSFEETEFKGKTDFHGVRFGSDAIFIRTTFAKAVEFREVTFESEATFSQCAFMDHAEFSDLNWEGEVTFYSAQFAKSVQFKNCHFSDHVDYSLANFCGPAAFSYVLWPLPDLRQATFEMATFSHVADFTGSSLESIVVFKGAVFKSGLKLDQIRSDWVDEVLSLELAFSKMSSSVMTAHDIEGGCRVLKQEMVRASDKANEFLFYRLELLARRAQLTWRDPEWTFSWIYDLVSGYGMSIVRPVAVLFAAFILFSLLYYPVVSGLELDLTCAGSGRCQFGTSTDIMQSSNLALSRMVPFGPYEGMMKDFARALEVDSTVSAWFMRLLGSAQSLVALVATFLLGLALRRRFQIN